MKKQLRNMEEMGITSETLFKLEKAMPLWLQYEPGDFIQIIVHEIREKLMGIDNWARIIHDDSKIAPLPLGFFGGHLTVREDCDAILADLDTLKDILNIAWEYSKAQRAKDAEAEE